MATLSTYALRALLPAALAAAVACGTSANEDAPAANSAVNSPSPDGGTATAPPLGAFGTQAEITGLAIDPPQATIDVTAGAPATKAFKLVATFADGTKATLTSNVTWSASPYGVGAVDAQGVYTPTGQQGGNVTLKAQVKAAVTMPTAAVTVKLLVRENSANAASATQAALRAAAAPDTATTWSYPYDGTVFPRGMASPELMWSGGAAADTYLVRLKSPTFDLESFVTATPPARVVLPQATWEKAVDSTSGALEVAVSRFDGTAARVVAKQHWTVAPASMRGTIYYWANNLGRVLRIKPGAAVSEDFTAGFLGNLPASGCTTTCHTVSADGSTLVSGGDTLGGTFDLKNNKIHFDEGGAPGSSQKRRWAYSALSPNGKYIVESFAPWPVGFGTQSGLFLTATKTLVANSGLDGVRMGTPAFAPNGSLIAFVDYQNNPTKNSLMLASFDAASGKASNIRELVKKGALEDIAFPSVSPDAKWVVYQRGSGVRTDRGSKADLYLASTATGREIRLAALNGDAYPFVAGDRDKNWNFEPTFAPVASGGYFWVVITSRRTLGNRLVGDANSTKQLWVAAIDQNPTLDRDPSHPAFHLPGQTTAATTAAALNMRGFWSLETCRSDGGDCETGSQCCGGYCEKGGERGVCRSAPAACAQDGDRCDTSSDCCNSATGVTCINRVCSEPTPR